MTHALEQKLAAVRFKSGELTIGEALLAERGKAGEIKAAVALVLERVAEDSPQALTLVDLAGLMMSEFVALLDRVCASVTRVPDLVAATLAKGVH